MKPEMIFLCSNFKRGTLFKITEPLAVNRVDLGHWITLAQEQKGKLLTNSWIRFDSRRARMLVLAINMHRASTPWLAQANHIFTQLHTTSQLEDYVCVTEITFILRCLPNTHNTEGPEGYLFICPPENFRTGVDSFQWPNCPAYWSHDPSGTARLSTEDAKAFGFPVIHIETRVYGCSWDARVYEGLRRFHRGRGFDPDSQEAAIHLGYPLYKLSSVVTRFECVD
ncbi:hypothetical protein B0H14DRAFT_2723171 [Mycena olivaceomarginata]|nr:hypothetical protein B0H14DRAFT_2723171 [Mycena olivaceomarginata]